MSESVSVAVICTIKNEEKTLGIFMDSLLMQSRHPDEIIIVDGGSKDNTLKLLDYYLLINPNIKIISAEDVNISEGRNIAIENAKSDVIASTDAGCILDKNWLYWLILPFENNSKTDVVSGWYEGNSSTEFGKLVEKLTFPNVETIVKNPNSFLPSSRSIAYKKECWQKVGGYPVWLHTAEDTLFDISLKRRGYQFIFSPNAIVFWNIGLNLRDIFKKYHNYSVGDGEAQLFFNNYLILKYIPLFLSCILIYYALSDPIYFLILLLCIIVYMLLYSYFLNINLRFSEYLVSSIVISIIIFDKPYYAIIIENLGWGFT